MAYVYRHIRLDKNIPFYIGIGSDDRGDYKRAKESANRSRYWHNIVNSFGYDIEIMLDGISWEDAQKKEIEFISLYGRKSSGGILCNLTDGGGGSVGLITSEEAKKKQSLRKIGKIAHNKGKPMPPHQLEILIKVNTGRPSWNKGISPKKETVEKQIAKLKDWYLHHPHPQTGKPVPDYVKEKIRQATKGRIPWNKGKPMLPHVREALTKAVTGKPSWSKGKPMLPHVKEKLRSANIGKPSWNSGLKMSEEYKMAHPQNKPITPILMCKLNGELLEEYESTKDAALKTGYPIECIRQASRCQYGRAKTDIYKGVIWKQKNPEINRALKRINKKDQALLLVTSELIAVGV